LRACVRRDEAWQHLFPKTIRNRRIREIKRERVVEHGHGEVPRQDDEGRRYLVHVRLDVLGHGLCILRVDDENAHLEIDGSAPFDLRPTRRTSEQQRVTGPELHKRAPRAGT